MPIIASSDNQLPPRLSKDEDATDFFDSLKRSNLPSIITDAMQSFFRRPTLKLARKVLSGLGIPHPLRSQLKDLKKCHYSIGGALDTPAAIHQLLAIDTLHDLADTTQLAAIHKLIVDGLRVQFPKDLKQSFLSTPKAFTKDAATYLCNETNIKLISAESTEQTKLVNTIISTRTYTANKLEIVMDNLVANVKFGATLHGASLGLAACAYILLLCNALYRLGKIKDCSGVVIYDGWFQLYDGNKVGRFLTLYSRAIKRTTAAPQCQITSLNTQIIPTHFNANLGVNARLMVYTNSVTGDQSPYIAFNGKNYLVTSPTTQPDPELLAICEQIHFPHYKRQFINLVETHKKQSRDLWYLNFLRDCIKAEVALQKGAIYITHDRLAYLYYRIIGGHNGFFLHVDQSQQTSHPVYSISV